MHASVISCMFVFRCVCLCEYIGVYNVYSAVLLPPCSKRTVNTYKVSKSDNPLTPSKAGSVSVRYKIL